MTFYEIPRTSTHSLDKYRNANIDYISSSQISLSGNLFVNGYVSGSQILSSTTVNEASYIVWSGSGPSAGPFFAKNGTTGNIDYSGSNANTVIQSVLNGLTSGRTWKEKVLIKGAYTNLGQIQIPSYTTVELQGYLKAQDNLGKSFIVNANTGSGDIQIEIYGGIWDGNRANQNVDMSTILIVSGSYVSVHNTTVYGGHRESTFRGEGIEFQSCISGSIVNNFVRDSKYDGIKVRDGCFSVVVDGNVIDIPSDSSSGGIQIAGISNTSSQIIISQNTIRGILDTNSTMGIKTDGSPTPGGVADCIIQGNTIYGCNWGIALIANSNDNLITNNILFQQVTGGLRTYSVDTVLPARNKWFGNKIHLSSGSPNGVQFDGTSTDNQVCDNDLYGTGSGTGMNFNASNIRTIVKRNKWYGSFGTSMTDNANTTIVYDSFIIPFTRGTNSDPLGWVITGSGDEADVWFHIPKDIFRIRRMRLWGVSGVTETHAMMLDLTFYSAADNENYTTHTWVSGSSASTSTNFGTNDIINWKIESSPTFSIAADDTVYVKVLYTGSLGTNTGSNVYIQSLQVEYI